MSFCGRVHGQTMHPWRGETREEMRSPLAIAKGGEGERGKGGTTLCPNHAIVWPLIVDVPPAARVENDGKDEKLTATNGVEEARVGEQDEGSWEEGLEGGGLSPDFRAGPGRLYQQRGKIAPEGCVSDYEDGTRKTRKGRKRREFETRPWKKRPRRNSIDDNLSSVRSINLSRLCEGKSTR